MSGSEKKKTNLNDHNRPNYCKDSTKSLSQYLLPCFFVCLVFFFLEIDKLILKLIGKFKGPRLIKKNLDEVQQNFPRCKPYYKWTVTKTV